MGFKEAEEILQKQRKAEEEFLKILREFDPENPEESFKKLWVSERCYINHIEDYGIPSFREVDRMIRFINEHKKVIISCIGGHGRTGTILAIWCGLNGIENPIEYVRENYSYRAIETEEQEEFIKKYLRCKNEKNNNTN